MDYLALAAAFTVMGAVVTGMLAVYQYTASPRANLERRLDNLLAESTGFDVAATDFRALREKHAGRIPIISAILEGKSWTEETATRLERADIKLTVSEFMSMRILLSLFAILAVMLAIGNGAGGIVAMIIAGFVAFKAPNFYLGFAAGRRLSKMSNQLIEALSMIANSLKAGFGLMQSMDLASKELTHPIATELRHALHDINVGSTTEEALQGMAKRSGSDDLDIVITAMLIQQSTGGNLAEILDNVAHTMRERIRIRGEIKTLTSQQMITGFIIGGLPFAMAILFSLVNPEYMKPLYTELIGKVMLAGAAMLEIFGVILIKRILAIEV